MATVRFIKNSSLNARHSGMLLRWKINRVVS
jgi:hypothetical protein